MKDKTMNVINLNTKRAITKEKPNHKTDDITLQFNNGDSFESYTGGFEILPSFDETDSVPINIIDFGVDENGVQITKAFEDCFFIFELNNKRYIYACAYYNQKQNSKALPPVNLLAMADYFGVNKALGLDEFRELYIAYNASITGSI